jgi:hypothetical protein
METKNFNEKIRKKNILHQIGYMVTTETFTSVIWKSKRQNFRHLKELKNGMSETTIWYYAIGNQNVLDEMFEFQRRQIFIE